MNTPRCADCGSSNLRWPPAMNYGDTAFAECVDCLALTEVEIDPWDAINVDEYGALA